VTWGRADGEKWTWLSAAWMSDSAHSRNLGTGKHCSQPPSDHAQWL
jgi:hypothetical protein